MDNDKLFRLLDGDLPAGEIPGALAELVADGDARVVGVPVCSENVVFRVQERLDARPLVIFEKVEFPDGPDDGDKRAQKTQNQAQGDREQHHHRREDERENEPRSEIRLLDNQGRWTRRDKRGDQQIA